MRDDALTSGFLSGDRETIDRVRAAIRGALGPFGRLDASQRQELEQEALVRVFVGLHENRFRGEASLETYSRKVARYTCLEHLRRRRRDHGEDPDGLGSPARWSAPEQSLLRSERHDQMLRVLFSLSSECRDLLYQVFVERRTSGEVAERLGITEITIRTRVHRCRSKIRDAIRRYDEPRARTTVSGDPRRRGIHE